MSPATERILLVNDNLFFSARILSVLDRAGYRIETAITQKQALEMIDADRPALVIFNLGAQRLGGIEMIRQIKAKPGSPRVLAFLSHMRIPPIREIAMSAGTDRLCANSAISARLPVLVRETLDGTSGIIE